MARLVKKHRFAVKNFNIKQLMETASTFFAFGRKTAVFPC
jgi:hypothetical protein